ncbi:vanadium-dependent haloperoxidase [Allorhizocola rhizosphaerae]|uniref:vanadium-dependent haloperoxidase n=1 Tax=Allorhizocola rhizosphaerae TaxID=1872709 RepID=UPI0013C2A62F|nr:vanadium-dependent haloperoxidase [Allorhizocola rhizosphaerae]
MRPPISLARNVSRALAVVCMMGLLAAPVGANSAGRLAFDFDTGNAIREVAIPAQHDLFLTTVSASDVSLVLRHTVMLNNAWFDATAPYHPTAVGVASRLGRRPPEERVTHRQRNIAILYATYRLLNSQLPQFRQQWREMLLSVGLNPDDNSQDLTTPVGIGNRAGNAVVASRLHDGMNQLGDEGGRKYNRQPYADYLGYVPVNTADTIRDPARWQPNVVTTGNGIFRVQEFVTPQWSVTRPYSYRSPAEFTVPPPANSDPATNPGGYRRQTDEVLAISAGLNDQRKILAEHFDDKFRSLPTTVTHLADTRGYSLDQFIAHNFLVNMASFDAGIATWHFKRRYDAVRPFTAIRYLYGNRAVTAWGGPGRGTVNDIKGSEWRSYMNTADHPEYPSASATICAAHAQASRRITGTDQLGQTVTVARGTSVIEPGITPAADLTLGPWHTWTQWSQECGQARLFGGVHFRDAVTAAQTLGTGVGDRAHAFVVAHLEGRAGPPS